MAAARALAATLTGTPTAVAYPAMPVTIKTPACPVCVSPVARDAEGEWSIEADGQDVKALFLCHLNHKYGTISHSHQCYSYL